MSVEIRNPPPPFVRGSELLGEAYELAFIAHHGPPRRGDTDIDHPIAVAELLHQAGFSEEVVAAALLHDVAEDTSIGLEEIVEAFGPAICRLVREMTEDARIPDYERRKAEHRWRVAKSRPVAAIYAADKLAKARGADTVPRKKLDHYRETLKTLRAAYPGLPFLDQLDAELQRLTR